MKKLLLILLILNLSTNVFAANKWLNQNNTDAITGAQNVSDLDSTVTAYLQDPLNDLITHGIWGCTLTRTSATVITVSAGEVVCSNGAGTIMSPRKNTSTTTMDIAGAAGVGALDSGSAEKASTWYDLYAVADANATTFTAIAAEQGVALNDVTHYRYIGSFYNDAAQDIQNFYWFGNGQEIIYMWDVPINITTTVSAGSWSAATSCSAAMPDTSTCGIFGAYSNQANGSSGVSLKPNGATGSAPSTNGMGVYSNDDYGISGELTCMTDSSQQIQYYNHASDTSTSIELKGFLLKR